MRFQLFRIRMFHDPELFPYDLDRGRLLKRLLDSRPSAELRRGYSWHIGNVLSIDGSALYFALGRTTKCSIELYDDETKNFVQGENEESPYTHVILDFDLQILSIAYKQRLAGYTSTIAGYLEKLLNQQDIIRSVGIRVDITAVKNPHDLLTLISQAACIKKCTIGVSLPNLFDVHEDFEKPFQKLLASAKGSHGKTEMRGEDLDKGVLSELAHSSAASGNDVAVRMKVDPESQFQTVHLRDKELFLDFEDEFEVAQPEVVLSEMREKYHEIRDSE